MPRGGKRAGAGRKKGRQTLDKEAARDIVRLKVFAELGPLIASQISNAKGIHYLVVRDKASGKFLRVGKGRAEKLKAEEEIIEIWEKDPSVQAFTDLLNRALDKPAEQMRLTGAENGPVEVVFRWQK
jgi:hypothetical protein